MSRKTNYPKIHFSPEMTATVKEYLFKYGGFHVENLFKVSMEPINRKDPRTKKVTSGHRIHVTMSKVLKREIRQYEVSI